MFNTTKIIIDSSLPEEETQENIIITEEEFDKEFDTTPDSTSIPLRDRKTFIYKIVNKLNNRTYIGIGCDIKLRWKTHRVFSKYIKYHIHNPDFYGDMHELGIDNFHFETIHVASNRNEAYIIEKRLIKELKDNNKLYYNITSGGGGAPEHNVTDDLKNQWSDKKRGEKSPWASLTNEQADEIRALYQPYVVTGKMLGEEYGVSRDIIKNIVTNRSYRSSINSDFAPQLSVNQRNERNKNIIEDFKTCKYTRDDLEKKYNKDLSSHQIGKIISQRMTQEEIELIDNEIKKIISVRLILAKNTPLSSAEALEEILILRESINPLTGKKFTTEQIGDKFKVSRQSIEKRSAGYTFNTNGSPIKDSGRKPLTDQEKIEIFDLYNNAIITSKDALADIYGCDPSQVRIFLPKKYKELGIDEPKYSRYSKFNKPFLDSFINEN